MTAGRFGIAFAAFSLAALAAVGCGDSGSPVDDGETGGSMEMKPEPPLTDAAVFTDAAYSSSWTWWKDSDTLVAKADASPHTTLIRVRYNTAAASQLDTLGRVVDNAAFPDRSIIAKEVYNGDGDVQTGLLVMYKAEGDPNAGHGSWLWAEFSATGTVRHSIADNNASCHDCHNTGGNDHTQMGANH